MKPGDSIKCPHCGKNSFLAKKSVMDGWEKKGEILTCSSCTAKIADYNISEIEKSRKKSESLSKLENLLGTKGEKKPEIKASDDEKKFCRDCKYFMSHPFLCRCGLHSKNVEPMDDCGDFERKK